jgi:glycosyltransferase involved in cell wall biosynthesis
MKIAYITAQIPYGPGEAFVLPEVIELRKQGHEIVVFPLRPEKVLAQGQVVAEVERFTIAIPLFNFSVFWHALKLVTMRPKLIVRILGNIFRYSGSFKKILKNLAVVPKGLVLGKEINKRGIEHIHAYWASTPSTAAYIASLYSRVSWSFTAHRWDIAEGNMLSVKAKSSKFIRAINTDGAEEIKGQIPSDFWQKVKVIHVGVTLPPFSSIERKDLFTIACVANLVPKKGHKYLLHACSILQKHAINLRCLIFGDGQLRDQLQQMANELNLNSIVEFCGKVAHDEILKLYASGDISAMVLPSIETKDGEKEGIPVALMEAMAAGVPVISTTTGGIPELLGDGSGILVPPEDSEALADAIEEVMKDPELRRKIGAAGKEKVRKEFAIDAVVAKMIELFMGSDAHKTERTK